MSHRATIREVQQIREQSVSLQRASDRELVAFADKIRQRLFTHNSVDVVEVRNAAFALSIEAVRRTLGFEVFDNQIRTALALVRGDIAEMQTGEGKTLSAVPAAVWMGMHGQGVHVATPNVYLARRDGEQVRPVFEAIGLSVGIVPEGKNASLADKRSAYDCDVTYATGYELGFDFLRDQLKLQEQSQRPIGASLYASITQPPEFYGSNSPSRLELSQPRGQGFAIIDEADHVLIDDALSPLVLALQPDGEASDADAVRLALRLANELESGEHFEMTPQGHVHLTRAGQESVYSPDVLIPTQELLRPWHVYVMQALAAKHAFLRDTHYVLRGEKVKIVEGSTGRIFDDRTWQAGLHQAIEAKEGLLISPESQVLAQVTRQKFFRRYRHLSGMTGTAANCRNELKAIYDANVQVIPLRQPSRRRVLPIRVFDSRTQKLTAVADSVVQIHRTGQPILIGTKSISDSLAISTQLQSRSLSFQLLNGLQSEEEAEIVSRAGKRSAITIATNLAGRGTDIKISDEVAALGGLHVVVAECHQSARIDRQLIGRCARQGDPGSTQSFVSAEDELLQCYSPWLAKTICAISVGGEVQTDLEKQIRKAQANAERVNYTKRLELFRSSEREATLVQ